MNPTQHPSNNGVLSAPREWDHESLQCKPIAITRMREEGQDVVVSFWRPTADELAVLNDGGTVSLWVWGSTMPPVALTAEPKS